MNTDRILNRHPEQMPLPGIVGQFSVTLFLRARYEATAGREENIRFFSETMIRRKIFPVIFLLARIAYISGFQQLVYFIDIVKAIVNVEGYIRHNPQLRSYFLTEIKSYF